MSTLAKLQNFVAGAIQGDAVVGERADVAADAAALLVPSPRGIDPAGRLEIYREQYWLRHQANLRQDFPAVAWLLGEESFRELCAGYLRAHPPGTWNLQRLGAHFPAFLASAPAGRNPLVLDAARLDWAFVEVFDAPDAAPLDLSSLAGAPEDAWPGAHLDLHPAVRRLALEHPAHALRDAIVGGGSPVRPSAAPTHVVVWRDGANVLRSTAVEAAAFALLGKLADGDTLGRACEAMTSGLPEEEAAAAGAQVGPWFQQWTASGWVSAVRLT